MTLTLVVLYRWAPVRLGGVETELLVNGRIYTDADPRAEAMLVADGTVVWTGTSAAARALEADRVVDLEGVLVTPAFVDAHVDLDHLSGSAREVARSSPGDPHRGDPGSQGGRHSQDGQPSADRAAALAQAAALGVACLHDVAGHPSVASPAARQSAHDPLVRRYERVWESRALPDPEAFADAIASEVEAGAQPVLLVAGEQATAEAARCLTEVAARVGHKALIAASPRLEGTVSGAADTLAALAATGAVAVCPAPGEGLGAGSSVTTQPSADLASGSDLPALALAGVPWALGSFQGEPGAGLVSGGGYRRSPWATVRAAAYPSGPGTVGVSVRAAFRAHTLGGWRAGRHGGEGRLQPGAPATYAVWQAGRSVVAAPDDRVQRWSTDPRSAVPGLPDLVAGAPLPRCLRTARHGVLLYEASDWSGTESSAGGA